MTFSSSSRDEVEVRLGAVDEVVEEAHGELAGGDADVFLGVGVDDVVDAALAGAARLAAGDLGAGQVLQLQGDVLDDVPHPGAFAHALQEPARLADGAVVLVETGQQLGEVLVEAGDLVGRPLLQLADVDLQQDGRHAGPDVGPAEDGGIADLQRHGINSGDWRPAPAGGIMQGDGVFGWTERLSAIGYRLSAIGFHPR